MVQYNHNIKALENYFNKLPPKNRKEIVMNTNLNNSCKFQFKIEKDKYV